eukprot:11156501-Heterocapsa_arctica.AAC.1
MARIDSTAVVCAPSLSGCSVAGSASSHSPHWTCRLRRSLWTSSASRFVVLLMKARSSCAASCPSSPR